MSDKLTKKELKEPDAFVKAGQVARGWFQENVRLVLIVCGVVLLGVGGAASADYMRNRGEDQAAQQLGAALKLLERPVSETATTTGSDAPFKSNQERDEALVKAMGDFRQGHRGTRSARTAAMVSASAQLRMGKYDDALEGFADYVKSAGADEPMRAAALESQGYAYEAKGELDKAMAVYEQLERENKGEFLAGMGLYHRARVLQLQGKKADAAKAFSEVAAAHPNTEAASLSDARLKTLRGQGIVVDAPPPAPAAAGDAG